MKHKSQNWHAVESTDLIGSEYKLTVTGEVQTLKSNETPALVMAHPQGFVKDPLILELIVETTSEIGSDIVRFVPVTFYHKVSSGEYRHVMIRGDVDEQKIAIERVLS